MVIPGFSKSNYYSFFFILFLSASILTGEKVFYEYNETMRSGEVLQTIGCTSVTENGLRTLLPSENFTISRFSEVEYGNYILWQAKAKRFLGYFKPLTLASFFTGVISFIFAYLWLIRIQLIEEWLVKVQLLKEYTSLIDKK